MGDPRQTRRLDAAQAAALVEQALGAQGKVLAVEPIPQGHGHEVWRVQTSRGTVTLKLGPPGVDPRSMESLALALEAAEKAGVAAPRLLWFCAAPDGPGARPVLLQTWLEGLDGEAALESLGAAGRARYFEELGRTVGRLHTALGDRFTASLADPEQAQPTWLAAVEARLTHLIERTAAAGVLAAVQLDSAAADMLGLARQLSPRVRPVLTHRDLYPPNTVLLSDGAVALLDFEHASYWDPVHDWVKLRFWLFEPYPESEVRFRDGHAEVCAPDEAFEDRLRLCTGLELLAGLTYWRTRQEHELEREWQRRFAGWLAAGR